MYSTAALLGAKQGYVIFQGMYVIPIHFTTGPYYLVTSAKVKIVVKFLIIVVYGYLSSAYCHCHDCFGNISPTCSF